MSFKIVTVDDDLLNKSFDGSKFIKVNGCVLPDYYANIADDIENFEVRDDDVWVCSFPKTGTTWTQEMVWCIANDLDFERAKSPLNERYTFFEVGSSLWDRLNAAQKSPTPIALAGAHKDARRYLDQSPSPRFIKTHLPFNLLPRQLRNREKTPKIVYVMRDVKDTCISYFHHSVLLNGFRGDFRDFVDFFLQDKLRYSPFYANVLSYWEQRNHENVLFLKYEDMKKDLPSVIMRTARWFDKDLTSVQVSTMNNHLSLANMKANPAVNFVAFTSSVQKLFDIKRGGAFIRSGNTEQWKSEMTPEIIKRFNDWTRERLQGTDYSIEEAE